MTETEMEHASNAEDEILFEIKPEFLKHESAVKGVFVHHVVIRIYDIRRLLSIAKKYDYYSRRTYRHNKLHTGITMIEELFYSRNPTVLKGRKPIVPLSLYNDLKYMVETFENTHLPYILKKSKNTNKDVMLYLVSEDVIFPKKLWCCFYSTFDFVIRRKEYLKNLFIHIVEYIYKIKAGAVLILPSKYYIENEPEERRRYQQITEIGFEEYYTRA